MNLGTMQMFESSLSLRLGLCSWVLPSLCRVFGEGCGSGSVESSQSLRRSLWLGFRRVFAVLARRSIRVIPNFFHEQDVDGDAEEGVCTVLGSGGIFWHIASSR
jgi:hypothetical protein